jgi:hypothetical protein
VQRYQPKQRQKTLNARISLDAFKKIEVRPAVIAAETKTIFINKTIDNSSSYCIYKDLG